MQQLNFKEQYDVIVIGAGVAGLTTAALLGKAGLSVCVLEMAANAGGYLAGFRRKDFRFDTAIHWLNQCGPGGLVTRVFDVLGNDYPHPESQTVIRRYKGETHDYLLTNQPDKLKEQWIAEFPEDKAGIERFFKAAKRLGRSFHTFNGFFRSEETMSFLERLKNKRHLMDFGLPFIPLLKYSGLKGVEKGLNAFFTNEKLKKIFAADTDIFSCLVPIGWAYYGDYQSPPKGGGQMIPEWLLHVIDHFRGEVYYHCQVQQIDLKEGQATGVTFHHRGKEYSLKAKHVVAACDVETVYEKMLPAGTIVPKLLDKLHKAELYSSSITISIALDCPTQDLGFGAELVHLASEEVPRGGHCDGNPETSEISILAPSIRDGSLAPEGCGTLVLFMPAFMDYENHWMTETDETGKVVRGEAYRKLKTEVAEVLLRRVEETFAPGLRQHILFYDVATPITHWRYTGNKGGTMMGTKPGKENMQGKVARYRTPVPNLILSSHWAELGGGVPIAVKSAANASLLVLRQAKPSAFKALARYMDGKLPLESLRRAPEFQSYDDSWVPEPTPAQKKALRHLS